MSFTAAELAARKQAGEKISALLRTPKTRSGLAAAAAAEGMTENYVFGWLAMASRRGEIAHRPADDTSPQDMYVLAERSHLLWPPSASIYPAWMGPQVEPPPYTSRTVYRDGAVSPDNKNKKGASCKTRTQLRDS